MRKPFRSLSGERRKAVKQIAKQKFSISRSDVIASVGLLISIGAFGLSLAHYKMDESAQDQPFRLARYQHRLDSYKRFNDRVDDWMALKFDETALDGEVVKLAASPQYDKLLTMDVSRRAAALSGRTLAFYKAQVIERTYWPDVRSAFDEFDKHILNTMHCSEYIAGLAAEMAQHKILQSQVSAVVSQFDGDCHIRANATSPDIRPYQNVIVDLGRLLDRESSSTAR